MLDYTTIFIILIVIGIGYYVYTAVIDNIRSTKTIEKNIRNEIENIVEKLEEIEEKNNTNNKILYDRLTKVYDINNKMNEMNMFNKQRIISRTDLIEENTNNNDISPITENCFEKVENQNNIINENNNLFMSPKENNIQSENIVESINLNIENNSSSSSLSSSSTSSENKDNSNNINEIILSNQDKNEENFAFDGE
jgi:hypothetical protein